MVLTNTSRAANAPTSPTPIFQSNPNGRITGSITWPSHLPGLRDLVRRQLEDERRGRPFEERPLEDPSRPRGRDDAEDIKAQQDAAFDQGAVAGEERADEQRVDRQAGRAAHKRGDE